VSLHFIKLKDLTPFLKKLPKKFKISSFSVVRAELHATAMYFRR